MSFYEGDVDRIKGTLNSTFKLMFLS